MIVESNARLVYVWCMGGTRNLRLCEKPLDGAMKRDRQGMINYFFESQCIGFDYLRSKTIVPRCIFYRFWRKITGFCCAFTRFLWDRATASTLGLSTQPTRIQLPLAKTAFDRQC